MRVLICGDRNWTNRSLIRQHIQECMDNGQFGAHDLHIIQGMARGADTMAGEEAHDLGCFVHGFPAKWNVYGRGAGHIRNQQMLDEGKPNLVLAFHNDIEHSKGTGDMVRRARKAGIEVRIITENGHG
jgi:YspA, cpYpsA-related SLOG family